MQTRLTAGDAELTINPDNGCRIEGLRIGGTEVLRQGERYGSFPMVPWCGRTENGRFRNGATTHQLPVNAPPHAIHGTVRDLAWKTARASATEAVLVCELGDPWPYGGRVTQVFELAEDSLTLRFGVEAYDDSFPAQAGWHPWFLRNLGRGGQDVRVDFAPAWQEERGADHLPTGRRIDPSRPLGRLLRHARRRRRDPHLAGGAGAEGHQPHRVGRALRRAGGGGLRRAAVRPPNGLNTHPRLVTPIDPLEVGSTWSWRRP